MSKKRDRWPSQMMFLFAAVGSAVGLGNLWRFPYLAGKYGGGAFLIPYLASLFFIGFPLLIMEFALGQKLQQGIVGAMGKIDKRLSGVGLGAVLSSFVVSCYYAVIMGWCILYMGYAIDLSWGDDPKAFFFNQVLSVSESANEINGFAMPALGALAVSWILVYFSIWKGVKSVSAVIKVTMPLPILLLLILFVRNLFLPGALEGLHFYLRPDYSAIWDFEVWTAAITQIFFTLSLGFGVMTTYSSYRDPKSDIVKTALITSIADVAIALLAGLVVFSTIGYMAKTGGSEIEALAASGPSLTFVVLPKALSLIPGAPFFAFAFFLTLLSLAIDSLFSLVEAIAALFEDFFPAISKKGIVFFVCVAGFLGGAIFTTSAGIYYLDIADHFITQYGLILAGLLQTLAVGWIYGAEKIRNYINEVSDLPLAPFWETSIQYIIPGCLLWVLIFALGKDLSAPYEGYPNWALWAFGWGIILCILVISTGFSLFQKQRSKRSS